MSTAVRATGFGRGATKIVVNALFVASNVIVIVFMLNMTALNGASRLYENRRWVEHTREVRQQIRGVYAALLEAESASRGYVITHDKEFMNSYEKSESMTWARLADVRRMTADNPKQQARCDDLDATLRDKFAFLRSVMRTDASGRGDLERGRSLIRHASAVLSDMDAEEMQLYFRRDATMYQTMRTIYLCMMLILARDVIVLGLIAASGVLAYRQERTRRRWGAGRA